MRKGQVKLYTVQSLLARGVQQPNGCITIGKPTKSARYWLVVSNFKAYHAHRLMWILLHGEVPPGLEVCHTCDNGRCIKPDHLWLGTHKQNMNDCNAKGRRNPPRGERARGLVKLKEFQIREMHALRRAGMRYRPIAERFNVSYSHVEKLIRGKLWPHIWEEFNPSPALQPA